MKQKKNDDVFDIPSSYRVFSRVACNFIFPTGIERPRPQQGKRKKVEDVENENEEAQEAKEAEEEGEELAEETTTYQERIQHALATLNTENYL